MIVPVADDERVFSLPSLGADMERGTLLEWYVKPGDVVESGSVVALVSTDKADIDVEIWQSGTVAELLIDLDAEVPVGTPMLRFDGPRPGSAEPNSYGGDAEPPDAESAESPVGVEPVRATPPTHRPSEEPRVKTVRASPYARRLASEKGVNLAAVTGTGPGSAVLARDVEALSGVTGKLPKPQAESEPERAGDGRNRRMRQAIAERMTTANRDIPHYYLEHDVDLGTALAWLERHNRSRPVTERVLPAALAIKATALAAADVPELNGFWRNGRFEPAPGVDVAVVVSLRGGGLVTPKIPNADRLGLDEVMAELSTIVTAARRGSLRSSWMTDAGITLTNLGDRGVDRVNGVIFPPQVALVGIGGIRSRPWIVDGVVVARPVVTVSLAADHRASDGVIGSRFLTLMAEHLHNPEDS